MCNGKENIAVIGQTFVRFHFVRSNLGESISNDAQLSYSSSSYRKVTCSPQAINMTRSTADHPEEDVTLLYEVQSVVHF